MTFGPSVEALAARVEPNEMLLPHLVETDARTLHPERAPVWQARAHVTVDVVRLTFAGEDPAGEDEIALERSLVGHRAIDDVGERLRHGCLVWPRVHDIVLRGGTVYDGEGGEPYAADVAIDGDRIAAVMPAVKDRGRQEIDVRDLAVAPGFVNMLSWAIASLIADGRAQSDVRQGVTLEVFGEGSSLGPLTAEMRRDQMERQADIRFDINWTTLRQGLDHIASLGTSVNVASFVGATTVRVHELGYADRPPDPDELERMRGLVRDAMRGGALGVGSALIYTPGTFAKTDELIELCRVAADFGGMYISHLRNEGD